jgi:F-type H+-transporting ATPase subunit a
LENYAKGLLLRAIFKANQVLKSGIKLLLLSIILVSGSFFAFANEAEAIQDSLVTEQVDSTEVKEEAFNPTPMILHHVGDSHSWDILEMVHFGLPCFLYTSGNGLSSFIYHDGKEVNGYKCEHGAIVREDGQSFLDLSITKNVFTMLLTAIILLVVFISVAGAYTKNKGKAPKGLQNVIETLLIFVRDDVAKAGIGPKYEKYLPYIFTIFFFILVNNLLGLVPIFPGGANVMGNIAVTLVLAVIAMVVINLSGNKGYWSHIVLPKPLFLWPIMFPVEVLGIFTKPIALMIRLFANMVAGHIIVLSLISLIFVFGKAGQSVGGSAVGALIAVPFTLFISLIEVLVAFIQAFIFATLVSVFIGMAVEEHGHEGEEHH